MTAEEKVTELRSAVEDAIEIFINMGVNENHPRGILSRLKKVLVLTEGESEAVCLLCGSKNGVRCQCWNDE